MNKTEKTEMIEMLRESLQNASSVVVASSEGMNANEVADLRMALTKEGVTYKIIKNTLARLAVQGTDMEKLAEHFRGSTAIVFHPDDPAIGARILIDFQKDNKQEKLVIKAGFLSGSLLDETGVQTLSTMPTLDEARSMILRVINAAPTSIVRVINAVPQSILFLFNARKDSLIEGESKSA